MPAGEKKLLWQKKNRGGERDSPPRFLICGKERHKKQKIEGKKFKKLKERKKKRNKEIKGQKRVMIHINEFDIQQNPL